MNMKNDICLALATALLLGCAHHESPGEPLPQHKPADPVEPEPKPVRERVFGAFEPWSSPIDDYLAVGTAMNPGVFDAHIHDLAPLGDRMFIGYGDATYNLGEHIPIEFRFFTKGEPAIQPATIDGAGQGAPQTSPYQSGEEQIDRFRVLDGVLFQAGIDSIDPDELHTQATTDPPSIQGNIYRFEGEAWKKHRSITGGEHVHDVTRWNGATYGVGSGADTRIEFEAGRVFRYLWRSDDLGASFSTVERVEVAEAGAGDTRWIALLPLEGGLYLFGYESVFATNTASIRNAVFDGTAVTDLAESEPLGHLFPDDVLVLPDGSALLFGVDVGTGFAHYTAVHVAPDGTTQPLASLAGTAVLDAALTDTGEVLYMVATGDAYGGPTPSSIEVRVLAADASAPDAVTELLRFTSTLAPSSIAYWQDALFLGTADGKVLRATSTPSN
jgi:hypothetical protein